jgi:cytochrome c oxidase subunit I
LLACLFVPSAAPILTNYVPSLDHPLFAFGITTFFVGVALEFFDLRMLPSREQRASSIVTDAARPGVRTAAIAFVLALLTFAASASSVDRALAVEVRYELIFWGGGHVLQVASVAGMLAVWLILIERATGAPVLSRSRSSLLFFMLVLPVLGAPLLPLAGVQTSFVHGAFTRIMQFGIFPVVTVFIVLCVLAIRRAGVCDGRVLGVGASMALTVLGFVIGALIRGPNTMVPAHYHASIGAVTAAFMTMSYELLAGRAVGARLARGRRLQPLVFGLGQMIFAIGFGLAGTQGMARKAYGAEQHIRTLTESIGLVTMGLGGVIAVASGLFFLVFIVRAALPGRTRNELTPWRPAWKNANT